MTAPPGADPFAAPGWTATAPGPLVGGPRDRPAGGALPTNIERFRALVCRPLTAADASGRRWLAALAAFELLRHGAAEPGGVLHANGRRIASMLGVAETTWCRSTRAGQAGYGPLLEAAGLLVREDWERYRLPAWEPLQHRAPDATLQGRFVYTHRQAFRATVVCWRLAGVSLAALGAWSLLRYCHTRWDTADLPYCDAAIARLLGVKPHTWASWARELAGCAALQRLGSAPGAGWRLPLYFALRTGRGLDEPLTQPPPVDVADGQLHAGAAVQLHATSADRHAEPAAGLCDSRAREDPVEDGGQKDHPGGDVEQALDRLAAAAGDAWQQQQVRASRTLRARCAELLARTGWSSRRLAAELTTRELRSAREPVRVLAHRARNLLETARDARAASAAPRREPDDRPREGHDRPDAAASAPEGPQASLRDLDALDAQTRGMLLETARARLRRLGLPRGGRDYPDHHPLLRGEAVNVLQAITRDADPTGTPSTAVPEGPRQASAGRSVRDAGRAAQQPGTGPAPTEPGRGHSWPSTPAGGGAEAASMTPPDAQDNHAPDAVQPARRPTHACRHRGHPGAVRANRRPPARVQRSPRPAGRAPTRGRTASRVASWPRSRAPPAPCRLWGRGCPGVRGS